MKKTMIAAAFAAVTSAALAGGAFLPINCAETPNTPDCDPMVFKLTASGKTVQTVEAKDSTYKSVTTLKISKGAIAFIGELNECLDGACCYATADIFAQVKIGKKTTKIAIEEIEVGKWSVFGKNTEKVINYLAEMKKGSSLALESDLFLSAEDAEVLVDAADEDAEAPTISFWASAFGSMTAKNSKGKKASDAYCDRPDEESCVLSFTPKSYSGWFVGKRDLVEGDQLCFNCECGEFDIFGGTWKAVFQPKANTVEAAQKLAFGKVLFDGDDE